MIILVCIVPVYVCMHVHGQSCMYFYSVVHVHVHSIHAHAHVHACGGGPHAICLHCAKSDDDTLLPMAKC